MANIVIFKEKYGERMYDASTEEALQKAFYSILKERSALGYWYYEPTPVEESLTSYITPEYEAYESISPEVLATLPEEVQKKARYIPNMRARLTREYETEKKWWDNLQLILSLPFDEAFKLKQPYGNRGREQYLIEDTIEARSDYEYEGYTIEQLAEPKL